MVVKTTFNKLRRTVTRLIILALLANLLAIPSLIKGRFVGISIIVGVILAFTVVFTAGELLIENILCPILEKDGLVYRANMKLFMRFRAIYFFAMLIPFIIVCPSKGVSIFAAVICIVGILLMGFSDTKKVFKYIEGKVKDGIADSSCVTTYLSCRCFGLMTSLYEIVYTADGWNKIGHEIAMTPNQTYEFPDGPALNYWVYSWYNKRFKMKHLSDKLVIYYHPMDYNLMTRRQMDMLLSVVDDHIKRGAPVLCIYDYPILLSAFITPGADKDYLSLELKKRNIKFVFDQSEDWETVKNFLTEKKSHVVRVSGSDAKNNLTKEQINNTLSDQDYKDGLIAGLKKYTRSDDIDNKYTYVNTQILKLYNDTDNVELFYVLINMTEYIFHYRALGIAYDRQDFLFGSRKEFTSSMGLWCSIQSGLEKTYSNRNIIKSYNIVGKAVGQRQRNKKVITYSEICERITQLRNRYIGHGTMAFSVSDELLNAVIILTTQVLEAFYYDNNHLETDMFIDGDVPLIIMNFNHIAMLSAYDFSEDKGVEYLEYNSGCVLAENKNAVYNLDFCPDFLGE